VLLKEDYVAEALELPVGNVNEADPALTLPGSQLFSRNTTSVVVVQPTAADTPGGIEHQEAATIVEPIAIPAHLTLTEALENAYTTARGAYVRPATLPEVCSGLRVVVEDFTEGLQEPADDWFPGIFVTWEGTTWREGTNVAYEEWQDFLVRYAILAQSGLNNRQVLQVGLVQLVNLISEDNYLGATVNYSRVASATPYWSDRDFRRGAFQTASGAHILFADIRVTCWRNSWWDKITLA